MVAEGTGAPQNEVKEVEAWVLQYRRMVLDHVGAPADVDPATVTITAAHQEAWSYSEYTGGESTFEINVSWRQTAPEAGQPLRPGHPQADGTYAFYRSLTNEEVADFLNSLS